jgi:DNA-binding response OmpR family regulator
MTRILSLDDAPEMLQLIGLQLEFAGYEHLRTGSSHEALAILHSEPVDLLTQDCLRPGMNGAELYRRLKSDESLCRIPVLFISAVRQPEFAAECRSVYGDDYLVKPFRPQELLAAVTGLMKRHGKHMPTRDERAARCNQIRDRLRSDLADLCVSEERLDELFSRYSRLLRQLEQDHEEFE